jgi:uncharacterized protein YdiU (UPF0061 family)
MIESELQSMFAAKMGLKGFVGGLWAAIEDELKVSAGDWTIFWRVLCSLPTLVTAEVEGAFYQPLSDAAKDRLGSWLSKWHEALVSEGRSQDDISTEMKKVNPKFIPREWMLRAAYEEANELQDFTTIHELATLFEDPYSEHDASTTRKYFKQRPSELNGVGGVCHMTCSS